jgi:hypothetical protein
MGSFVRLRVVELIEPNGAVAPIASCETNDADTCLGSRACPHPPPRPGETPDANPVHRGNTTNNRTPPRSSRLYPDAPNHPPDNATTSTRALDNPRPFIHAALRVTFGVPTRW